MSNVTKGSLPGGSSHLHEYSGGEILERTDTQVPVFVKTVIVLALLSAVGYVANHWGYVPPAYQNHAEMAPPAWFPGK